MKFSLVSLFQNCVTGTSFAPEPSQTHSKVANSMTLMFFQMVQSLYRMMISVTVVHPIKYFGSYLLFQALELVFPLKFNSPHNFWSDSLIIIQTYSNSLKILIIPLYSRNLSNPQHYYCPFLILTHYFTCKASRKTFQLYNFLLWPLRNFHYLCWTYCQWFYSTFLPRISACPSKLFKSAKY